MSQPLAHLYDLALRTLDEQERRVDALRGRLGPVLAAAALGTSLLTGPALGGGPPEGIAGTIAIVVATTGLLVTLCSAAYVLGARRIAFFDVDPSKLTAALDREGMLDDLTRFYPAMIVHLNGYRAANAGAFRRLHTAFTVTLCGILVTQCGLALAAIVG